MNFYSLKFSDEAGDGSESEVFSDDEKEREHMLKKKQEKRREQRNGLSSKFYVT